MLKQLLEKQILHKISKGVSVESDLEKMNFFFLRGQLTGQEYDELLALIPHQPVEELEITIPEFAPEPPSDDEIEIEETPIDEEQGVVEENVGGEQIEDGEQEDLPVIIVTPEENEVTEDVVEDEPTVLPISTRKRKKK